MRTRSAMRRWVSGVFVLTLLTPSTADAFSWWKLDKLSGPKFEGVLLQIRVSCFPRRSQRDGEFEGLEPLFDDTQKKEEADGRQRFFAAGLPGGVVYSFCAKLPQRQGSKDLLRRRASLDVNVSWLRAERDERFAGNHRIHAITAGPSFSVRPNEVFEFGTAAHLAWFFSNGLTPFGKVMLEPVRVDVRVLKDTYKWNPTVTPVWWQEAFFVRGGYVWFPQGFDDGDFGAPADDDNAVPYVGFIVDVDYIARHFNWW